MKKYALLVLFVLAALQSFAQHDVPPTAGFEITGAVKKVVKFNADNINGYKVDSLGDLAEKNRKGEQKGIHKALKGILLKTMLDNAGIEVEKPKEYGKIIIVLTASDGVTNVFSWNELFNTEIGNHVYVITEMDGQNISQMPGRILVLSLADFNSGSRHLKGLTKIEVRKVE